MSPEIANPLRAGLENHREPPPATIVIFGASGDLTHRKLLPALYNVAYDGLVHPDTSIVGLARRPWSDEDFRTLMREALETHSRRKPGDDAVWEQLTGDMSYIQGEFADADAYRKLAEKLEALEAARGEPGIRLIYLATPPRAYPTIVSNLGEAGLAGSRDNTRLIVEKPFGRDLDSARTLNRELHQVFDEDQIYRIDHYLGKETVQNLLVFRLDNGIFEPLWNGRYVDHVQITVAESVGVGSRAGFYEGNGVVRDMLQNHMMQLLTLVAMEPPVRFDAVSVRDEKVKVLRGVRALDAEEVEKSVVRARYQAGTAGGNAAKGYLEEENVPPDSRTETFLAARFHVDNWRWGGTPFYLRSGKRLPKKATEIVLVFKSPPHEFFASLAPKAPSPNLLRLRIQPNEGISLSFESKAPGQTLHIEDVRMDFSYHTSFGQDTPDAYERLLLDGVLGDSTLFARGDEVELAWKHVDAIVDAWSRDPRDLAGYPAGTWGPEEAEELVRSDGRKWVRP